VSSELAGALVERFGELAKLQRATVAEIADVPGVDRPLAEAIKDTLERLTESSILDQYH
jgi:excinuclease UvrABC nuclease subunit